MLGVSCGQSVTLEFGAEQIWQKDECVIVSGIPLNPAKRGANVCEKSNTFEYCAPVEVTGPNVCEKTNTLCFHEGNWTKCMRKIEHIVHAWR